MTSVESQIARFVMTAQPKGDVVAMMRLSLLDWAACGVAGSEEPLAAILRSKGHAEGGIAEASVIGGGRLPAPRAALINGAVSHALDYDDTHFDHIGHTSVGVIPAALAIAERQGASFADFLTACLIGSEVAIHVGVWLGRGHYQVGFHQTATAGAFGAVAACLRLLGANEAQCIAGIGLVSTKAAGLKAQFGTMGKPLNAGLAAEAGVEAALWAMAGLTSTDQGLQAFGATHHGIADDSVFESLGSVWRMQSVSHKFHACCHGLHAMLEALGAVDVAPEQIARVLVATHPRWLSVCNKPAPQTGLEAKFSYTQTAAMALNGMDTSAIAAFSDVVAARLDLVALRELVEVIADPQLSEMEARVCVTLHDGSDVRVAHDLAAPLAIDLREAKLRRKASGLIGEKGATALWSVSTIAALTNILQV